MIGGDDDGDNNGSGQQQQVVIGQLAGLIPSFQFQQQREALRRSANNSADNGRAGYATIGGGGTARGGVMSSSFVDAVPYASKSLKRMMPSGGAGISAKMSGGRMGRKQRNNASLGGMIDFC